jgi:tetratricopeptide (TPR) repeat protein
VKRIQIFFILFGISVSSISVTSAYADTPDITTLLNKGHAALNEQQFNESLSYFDKVLQIQPSNLEALNGKGVILANLNEFNESMKYFDKALQIQPNNLDALNNKGAALIKLGKFNESLSYFDKVLQIQPSNLIALSNKKVVLDRASSFIMTGNINKFTFFCQIQIRNSAGQLVSYMEPQYVVLPHPDLLDVVLDTAGPINNTYTRGTSTVEKSIVLFNGIQYEKTKIKLVSQYDKRDIVASKSGIIKNKEFLIYAIHDGYQLTAGDTDITTWTIIRPLR